MLKAKISALGCFVPPRVLTNRDLSQMVETNDTWIVERTGIRERHIADASTATSDMAIAAARETLKQRGIEADTLDAILVCTVTPDMLFPSTACLVQDNLGAAGAWGFDLIAACSGFVYGITVGAHLIAAGTHRKVLVIGADTMSMHPMHMHGGDFNIVAEDGHMLSQPISKDTVQVAPGETYDLVFKANAAPGSIFPFHCHILSHLMNPDQTSGEMGGLITLVEYAK